MMIDCEKHQHISRIMIMNSEASGQYASLHLHVKDPSKENTIFMFCERHEIVGLKMCGYITEEVKSDRIFMTCLEKLKEVEYLNAQSSLHVKDSHFDLPLAEVQILVDAKAIELQDDLPRRYCFIHSETFDGGDNKILESILMSLDSLSQLVERIIVLNYGALIPPNFTTHFLDVTFFEINHAHPSSESISLAIMQAYMKQVNSLRDIDDHVLFLHTLDVSPTIRKDSQSAMRTLLLDSVVKHHSTSFHLLSSGVFDVVGSYYASFPGRFIGNFFWASSRYISHLAECSYVLSRQQAENWILSGYRPRIYIMSTSRSLENFRYTYSDSKYLFNEREALLRHDDNDFNAMNCTSFIVFQ